MVGDKSNSVNSATHLGHWPSCRHHNCDRRWRTSSCPQFCHSFSSILFPRIYILWQFISYGNANLQRDLAKRLLWHYYCTISGTMKSLCQNTKQQQQTVQIEQPKQPASILMCISWEVSCKHRGQMAKQVLSPKPVHSDVVQWLYIQLTSNDPTHPDKCPTLRMAGVYTEVNAEGTQKWVHTEM